MTYTGAVSPHAEILIWLEQYTDHMTDQQRDLMMGVEERNQLVEKLSLLKGQIQAGGEHDEKTEWIEESRAEAEALLAEYEGTPYYDQLEKALDGIINNGDSIYCRDEVTSIHGDIQAVIDGLQKDDQITMIQLQDVVSNTGKNIQQVSQMIAAENQTIMAIIGNIGR